MDNINGVINVYKEKGFTSHDVVAKLRGILKTKKIGHTGTLDPLAEGVLPVCIGNATKLCDMIMEKHKVYEAELVLGLSTDTEDMAGKMVEKYDGDISIDEKQLETVLNSFIGEYMQIPPMYSAIKVNGKKLYDLARQGMEIERKPRSVHIYGIEIMEINLPIIRIRVDCGKGTYIRSLCRDIGEKLGVYGCMGYLLRIKTGMFELEESHRLSEIQDVCDNDNLFNSGILIPTDEILCDYPAIHIKDEYVRFLKNGNPLSNEMFKENECIKDGQALYRVYCGDKFMAVYRKDENEAVLKVEKMFLTV